MTSFLHSPQAFHFRGSVETEPELPNRGQSSVLAGLPSVVGFCGPAGAGKTTAACYLVGYHPGWNRCSFADPLRSMLRALGLKPEDFTHDKKEHPHQLLCGKSPRQALQTLGTEWGRQTIGDDIWIRAATHQILNHIENGGRVVMDDVRFDNEAGMIRALGGIVIHLGRADQRSGTTHTTHASERGVSSGLIDLWIEAADVPELYAKLNTWLNHFTP